jgi:hypothetical protein
MLSVPNSVGFRQPVVESRNELGLGSLDTSTLTANTYALGTIAEARQDPHPATVVIPIVKAEYPSHPSAFNLNDMIATPECAELR